MTKCDRAVIGPFAEQLYDRAILIGALWTGGVGVVGVVAGYPFGGGAALMLGLVGAGPRFVNGQQRVLMARLWAQLALLMVPVEADTRTRPPAA